MASSVSLSAHDVVFWAGRSVIEVTKFKMHKYKKKKAGNII